MPTLRWLDSGVWAFVGNDDASQCVAVIVGEHGDWMLRQRDHGLTGPFRTINEAALVFWRRWGKGDPIQALHRRDARSVIHETARLTKGVIDRLKANGGTAAVVPSATEPVCAHGWPWTAPCAACTPDAAPGNLLLTKRPSAGG
jgi:hypothetical protein